MLVLGALGEKNARNPTADSFCVSLVCKETVGVQECLSQDATVTVEMARRAKLRSLCETRWASRADSLYTFCLIFRLQCRHQSAARTELRLQISLSRHAHIVRAPYNFKSDFMAQASFLT